MSDPAGHETARPLMSLERRRFMAAIAGGLLAAPLAAGAQPTPQVSRVGVLMNLYPPDAQPPQVFRQELRGLGYIEGQNLVIDWRYQLGRSDQLAALAAGLVNLKPDVLVADVTVAIRAAVGATRALPVGIAGRARAVGGWAV